MSSKGVLNLGLSWAARHWARYRPDHVAIQTDIAALTYKQLDDMAFHVAMYLLDHEIAPEQPVGVLASDASILFPMMLGTLRAGAQVILLSPALSPSALGRACEAAGVGVILIDEPGRGVPLRGRRIPWDAVVEHRSVGPTDRRAIMRFARPADGLWGAIVSAEPADPVRVAPRTELAMLMAMIGCAVELDIRSTTICHAAYHDFLVPATTLLVGGTVLAARDHGAGVPAEPERRIRRFVLSEIVRHWALSQPECIAMVNEDRTYTYGQLDAEIQRVANYLDDVGARPHQPIGVVAHDPVLCLLYIIGILRFGGHVILLNPDLPIEALELARKDSGCASVLIEDRLVDELSRAFAGCTLGSHARVKHAPSDDRPNPDPDPYGLWGIVYSSGTTGVPKGIVHSLLSIAMGYIGWSLELPLTRRSVVFVGRPMFYMAGLEIASATLLVGGTLLAPTRYSTAAYRRTCAAWKIDLAFFIPDQVRELVEEARSGLRPGRGAERILVMGSTLPLPIKRMIPEALGSRVVESWGNSEGLGTIADEEACALRPRSVGRPFLSDFLTIVDDQGEELPPWELGRVAGSSDAQLREYFHREDLNRSMFKDQLVLSEDLGYYDPEGYFYISGRVAGRFLRRGVPVFTTEIEEKLTDLDDILYSTVVGIPDAVEGHVPAAAVVLREGASGGETELLRAANARLPEIHRLARIVIVPSLPRNAAGKVVLDAVQGLFL